MYQKDYLMVSRHRVFVFAAVVIAMFIGYGVGAWQWRGMAVIESYVIGFDQGYSTGISDADAAFRIKEKFGHIYK